MVTARRLMSGLWVIAAFAILHLATDNMPKWIGFGVFVIGGLVILGVVMVRPDRNQGPSGS